MSSSDYYSSTGTNYSNSNDNDDGNLIDLRWLIPITALIVLLNACRVRHHNRRRRRRMLGGRDEDEAIDEAIERIRREEDERRSLRRQRTGPRGGRHEDDDIQRVGSLQWMDTNRWNVSSTIIKEIRRVEVMKRLIEKEILPIPSANEEACYQDHSETTNLEEVEEAGKKPSSSLSSPPKGKTMKPNKGHESEGENDLDGSVAVEVDFAPISGSNNDTRVAHPPHPDPVPCGTAVISDSDDETRTHHHNCVVEMEQQEEEAKESLPPAASCSICLEGYEAGQKICWSTDDRCTHAFHKDCIVEWLLKRDDCPICRTNYFEKERGEPRNGSS